MSRLKDRNRQVPNGMFFYEPSTKWRSTEWASFSTIVAEVIAHRQGNPHLMQKLGKSTELHAVENEVDAFVASVCDQMGWTGFTVGSEGSPPPKMKPPSQEEVSRLSAVGAKVKNLWMGLRTGNEWLDSGEPAVPAEQSESRAQTCFKCPKNVSGDLTSWFTKPAAALIQRQVEKLSSRKLSTTVDAQLGVCECCDCVMRLKVHTPIDFIKRNTADATLDKLREGRDCWVLEEIKQS